MKNMHKRQSKHCEGQSLKTYKKIIIALCVILFIFYIILFCSLSHAEQFTAKYRSCYDGRDYLNYTLTKANSIIVDISKRDSFGRYLGVIYVDDININYVMFARGYARVEQKGYHNWCK